MLQKHIFESLSVIFLWLRWISQNIYSVARILSVHILIQRSELSSNVCWNPVYSGAVRTVQQSGNITSQRKQTRNQCGDTDNNHTQMNKLVTNLITLGKKVI